MSIVSKLIESLGISVKQSSVSKSNSNNYANATLSNSDIYKLIYNLRNLSDSYRVKYNEYELMSEDVIIQSALELYADDSTQLDSRRGTSVWVSSDDEALASDLNNLIAKLDIPSRIWDWNYNLAKSGDMYLKVILSDDKKSFKLEEVLDPSSVLDLYLDGDRVNFAEDLSVGIYNTNSQLSSTYNNSSNKEFVLYDPDEYIHFMVRKSSKTDIFEVPTNELVTDDNGNTTNKVVRYSIVRGVSMIEGVRSIYRILQALEDSLLSARISKANFTRVVNVEVGDNSTPGEVTQTMNSVKNMFESKASYDTVSGNYKSSMINRPLADAVFNPVRDGKGVISYDTIGGDFEVKSIMDIEYFKNKLFAGLKIPQSMLGFEECFRYSTKVTLLDGSTYTIGYMAENSDLFIGKSILTCSRDNIIDTTTISHVTKTRLNATFIRITLSNSDYVDVTPDHLMMLSNGEFIQATNLEIGDSLMSHDDSIYVDSIDYLSVTEDAYDLGVTHSNHTFLLSSGIFVHNSLGGFDKGDTLEKLDIRYSRTVKRLQVADVAGITSICNLWLKLVGRSSSIGKFTVSMLSPSSSDEMERLDELQSRVNLISDIVGTISNTLGESVDITNILSILINKYIDNSDLSKEITNELNRLKSSNNNSDDTDNKDTNDALSSNRLSFRDGNISDINRSGLQIKLTK